MALKSWLASSLVRHFPGTLPRRSVSPSAEIARSEQFSFQVVVRAENEGPQTIRVTAQGPKGWSVRVRRVGYVPVAHHNTPSEPTSADLDGLGSIPGFVPDPLFDEDSLILAAGETHAFWITVRPGRGATPGRHRIRVTLLPEKGRRIAHSLPVRLHDLRIPKRRGFHVTHWFYVDSLIDRYKTDLFDSRFWDILPKYIRNVVEHGQDTLYVPVFTPPLDGVKRPSQLLRVTRTGPNCYRFDWRDVRKYIRIARQCGIGYFEFSHLVTQWGARHAIRIYEGQGRDEKRLWPPATSATSRTYRRFLAQYLPELKQFLRREGILERSFFHISDEPHGEEHRRRYGAARAKFRELAPWMSFMDALSEIEFAKEGLVDTPVPIISRAPSFVENGIPSWCYYCGGPRGKYLNRLMDTPLPKVAMHGFLFYRWPFRGFLHWGYNYWYRSQTRELIDPYMVLDAGRWPSWAYGDPFVVYPGPNGPIDSMRWEVFAESLQDYALLQTLGIDRNDPLLRPLRSFADFPKSEQWRRRVRAKLLTRGERDKMRDLAQ